jgi:type I restriction enzyme, S subunit
VSELPKGWARVPLAELLDGIETGKSFKCDERPPMPAEIGVVKVSAVSWGEYREQESKTCLDAARVNPGLFVRQGDFLFSRSNTIELVGACVIAQHVGLRVMLSDKILRFRFIDERMKPWVLCLLRSHQGRAQIESLASGNQDSMRNIGQERIGQIEVPLPPSTEQTRIVAKLEELLSDLDAGVTELKAAQKKLAQYRQSLLKAAVEGALTSEWRTQHQPLETGAQLLARILRERRTRWEAKQLAKFEGQGKTLPKDWQAKYPEPVQPDTTDLPTLPQGWVWASGEQLCEFITKGTTPAKDFDSGGPKTIPFLRVTNLTDRGELDLADEVFVSVETHHGFLARSVVYPKDVLMNIVGPPLGQVAVVPSTFAEWNINQAIAIFRAVEGVLPWFICRYLLSPVAQRWLKARSKTTAGQTNLTLEVCRSLPFPLPPQDEQQALLDNLEIAMNAIANQGQAINRSLKQSTAQRQNILRAAFAGQLVPQDPNDEPASVLLERIRAERAARDAVKKPRGRKAKETA